MSALSSYFNSYERKSPMREEFALAGIPAGFSDDFLAQETMPDGSPRFVLVTQEDYPKLYEAIQEECAFRKIEVPPFYIDMTGQTRLGRAMGNLYCCLIEPAAYETFNKKELRAVTAHEIKHLFQLPAETPEESVENEYDCDRAAVESTDYETIRSYVHKAAELQIKQRVPKALQGVMLAFHRTFPHVLAEKYPFQWYPFAGKDPWHPSPAARMKAMREWAQHLKENPKTESVLEQDFN